VKQTPGPPELFGETFWKTGAEEELECQEFAARTAKVSCGIVKSTLIKNITQSGVSGNAAAWNDAAHSRDELRRRAAWSAESHRTTRCAGCSTTW
jgi:hypothetical protein